MSSRAKNRKSARAILIVLAVCIAWHPSGSTQETSGMRIKTSENLLPHFETVDGRKIFYVDGRPFTVLAVEIPWWDLVYGRHAETIHVYDYLYPAARAMGLNALKVPIKWSMVEPEKGRFDFSYIDHVKRTAEQNNLELETPQAIRVWW